MLGLFRNKTREAQISRLYDQILTQARDPSLYIIAEVPDTVEGRIDMMLLHLFLLMHRLRGEKGEVLEVARGVCDRLFAELDRAMREMGVGDLTVPKKMRKIADIYTGCSSAYDNALKNTGDDELVQALLRNVFGQRADRTEQAGKLADYVRRSARILAETPLDSFSGGTISFPSPSINTGTPA